MISAISLEKAALHITPSPKITPESSNIHTHFQVVSYTTSSGDLFIGYLLSMKG
jgi:hypothetical protein